MKLPEKYDLDVNPKKIAEKTKKITERSSEADNDTLRREIFGLIDLTTLDVGDNENKVGSMIDKINNLSQNFNDWPNVAAVCVYPAFISLIKTRLIDKNVRKASVAGSFPSSQTFLEIKLREVEMVLDQGADEIDIVLPLGKFYEEKYDEIFDEISSIKKITGKKHLKVIIESGLMTDPKNIRTASFLSLEAGADFIKTSTGKNGQGARPEDVMLMCECLKEFYEKTGKKCGIKPAGGISDASTAIQYYMIVKEVMGNEWLNPGLFRIGASRLANNLLGENYF
ncbi:MAG: deoxyribose-phosphate aldolase [Bacteroidota bacterium]